MYALARGVVGPFTIRMYPVRTCRRTNFPRVCTNFLATMAWHLILPHAHLHSDRELGCFAVLICDPRNDARGLGLGLGLGWGVGREPGSKCWAAGGGRWCVVRFRICAWHRLAPAMTRRRHVPRDTDHFRERRGTRGEKLVAVHQFAEVTEVVTASFRMWTITPGVASSKHFPVVMRIPRRVEVVWYNRT